MYFTARSLGEGAEDTKDKGIIPHGLGERVSKKFFPSKIALEERWPFASIPSHCVMDRKLGQIPKGK